MVKHTQIIRLSVFDYFVGLALKRLSLILNSTKMNEHLKDNSMMTKSMIHANDIVDITSKPEFLIYYLVFHFARDYLN